MDVAKRTLAATFLVDLVAALAFFGSALYRFSADVAIPRFSLGWELCEAAILLFRWLPALHFLAFALALGSAPRKAEVIASILPAAVLSALFASAILLGSPAIERSRASMEEQNNLYFTAWYGVWDPLSGGLSYASAGAPPAVLVSPDGEVTRLETGCAAVGIDQDSRYEAKRLALRRGSTLSLFSDGIYEVRTKDGGMLGLDAFIDILANSAPRGKRLDLETLLKLVRDLSADERFDDDVSIVELCLG